jgi:hypothetical protein
MTRPDAAITRLTTRYYNESAVSPTNPGGLDESDDGLTAGHVTNFPSALVDLGQAVAYAGEMAAAAETAAGAAGPAAAAASAAALASAATAQTAATAVAASAAGSFPAGTLAAPGWPVAGDGNTGLAQIGGADSVSLVAGGAEVLRTSVNAARVYGSLTLGDRGDGFGTALAFTPVSGSGPDVHAYVRTSDGALVFFLNKNRLGALVSIEALVIRDSGAVDFAQRPTVNGAPISGGFIPTDLSFSYTVIAADAGKLFNCTGTVTLGLTAAATLGSGFTAVVRNSGVGTITIDPAGSETINGALTITLVPSDWAILVCSGASWTALKQYGQSASSEMWSSSDKEAALSLTNGNLTALVSGATMQSGRAAVALTGKRYFEVRLDVAAASGLSAIIGIATAAASFGSSYGFATGSGGAGYASDTGSKLNNSTASTFGSTWAAGDVIGVATDDTSGTAVNIWFSRNGIWQGGGNPATGANPAYSLPNATYFPAITCKSGGQVSARWTGTLWTYTPPSGFTAIP